MKAKHFMLIAILCAALTILLALGDFLISSLIYLLLGFASAALYWEKSNEDENMLDSEGKYTLFSAQAKKTTEDAR